MQYISKRDPETIPAAFTGVNSVYQPDFNEIFTKHELERVPWQTNMESILREIAHKELQVVQPVMFYIDWWIPFLIEMHSQM